MIAPKMIESWFSLMSEAMRGSTEAEHAFRSLTAAATSQDHLMRWMRDFMPAAVASMSGSSQPQVFGDWLEQWWKVMGVVPRYRYVEALERNEELRRRLDECEKRSKLVSGLANVPAQATEETQKVFNLWGTMLDETLKIQSEMIRNLMPKPTGETTPEEQTEKGT